MTRPTDSPSNRAGQPPSSASWQISRKQADSFEFARGGELRWLECKITSRTVRCLSAEAVVFGESEEGGAARDSWATRLETGARDGKWCGCCVRMRFSSRLAGPTETDSDTTPGLFDCLTDRPNGWRDRLHYTSLRLYVCTTIRARPALISELFSTGEYPPYNDTRKISISGGPLKKRSPCPNAPDSEGPPYRGHRVLYNTSLARPAAEEPQDRTQRADTTQSDGIVYAHPARTGPVFMPACKRTHNTSTSKPLGPPCPPWASPRRSCLDV